MFERYILFFIKVCKVCKMYLKVLKTLAFIKVCNFLKVCKFLIKVCKFYIKRSRVHFFLQCSKFFNWDSAKKVCKFFMILHTFLLHSF